MQTQILTNSRLTLSTKVILPSALNSFVIVLTISIIYFSLLVWLMGSVRLAKIQIMMYGPWMLLLALGFSLQLFLFFYERKFAQFLHTACDPHGRQLAASGTATSTAMLACCAHHLFEVLPFLGLGAVGMFFGRFQLQFIELGIASNTIGILYMLANLQKHKLYLPGANFIFEYLSYRTAAYVTAYISVAYLIFSILRVFA